ncbi:MAG: hypothetical protein ACTSSP_00180 [Candidatus Asgardarchaeia archaeon]
MGCGCGKARKNRIARDKAKNKAMRKARKLKAKRLVKNGKVMKAEQLKLGIQAQRRAICSKCSHSIQTRLEEKSRIRICHKIKKGLSLVAISQNLKLTCPVGKFKAVGS